MMRELLAGRWAVGDPGEAEGWTHLSCCVDCLKIACLFVIHLDVASRADAVGRVEGQQASSAHTLQGGGGRSKCRTQIFRTQIPIF